MGEMTEIKEVFYQDLSFKYLLIQVDYLLMQKTTRKDFIMFIYDYKIVLNKPFKKDIIIKFEDNKVCIIESIKEINHLSIKTRDYFYIDKKTISIKEWEELKQKIINNYSDLNRSYF